MSKDHMDNFDFWYAVNNTEILRTPSQKLETFGTTLINYMLISQKMDSNKFRVREGKLEASRPQILTPDAMGKIPLEGFSNKETERYAEWMQQHAQELRLLQYGFIIKKQDVKDYESTEGEQQVLANVLSEYKRRNDPLSAVLTGVDEPWEVCLMKLIVEVIENSAKQNIQDFQERNMLGRGPDAARQEIEDDFLAAARDPSRIEYLHKKLQAAGVFDKYEDRFFALVRSSQK